jgi:AAA+ ATPase superfamily predicted ATPase
MFIGRETELAKLNKLYDSGKFECAIIYGRRRVGKTTLIREFCKDKKAVYFVAIESTMRNNLANLSESIFAVTMPVVEGTPVFDNLDKALDYLASLAESERIVFVIDGYPYLAGADKSVSSVLQSFIDHKLKNSKMMLILCGSSMSFMENQVLGYKSPLYGRRTAQFKINPFDYLASSRFCEGYSSYDKAVVYGITGGVPQYLERIDGGLSLRENIVSGFLDPSGYFFEEPSNLLKQELREPQTYNAIITAIANGASKLNEIATAVGTDTGVCSTYISSLISLGILKKEKPVGDPGSKKSIYRVADSMFRFWYRFVPANMNAIAANNGKLVYDRILAPKLNEYMGGIFEQMCAEYLHRQNGTDKLPFPFFDIGRWWGNDPKEKRQAEIDIVATYKQERKALFCECKFRNEPLNQAAVDGLIKNSMLLDGFDENYYYLFSVSGFTTGLTVGPNVRLVDLDMMYPL